MFGRTKRFARRSSVRSLHSGTRVTAAIVARRGKRPLVKSRGQVAGRSLAVSAVAALVLASIAMAGSVAVTYDAGPSWSRGGFDVGAPAQACTFADAGNAAASNACPAPELAGNGSSGRSGEQRLTP